LLKGLLLLERIDQVDGDKEADLLVVVLHRLDAEGGSDVGLAGARATDQHHIVCPLDERTSTELLDHILFDFAGGEVEARQVLEGGEAGRLGW
jgi:hypothetical protein